MHNGWWSEDMPALVAECLLYSAAKCAFSTTTSQKSVMFLNVPDFGLLLVMDKSGVDNLFSQRAPKAELSSARYEFCPFISLLMQPPQYVAPWEI